MKRNSKLGEQGFSLVELTVVMALMMVMIAAAVLSSGTTLNNFRANAAMDQVVGQLRSARAQAISQRREIQVQFLVATNQIQLTRLEQPSGATVFPPIDLGSSSVQYQVYASVPDTPMLFGKASAVYIGGQAGGPVIMKFTTTGAFIDGAGNPLNGTIFLGVPGLSNTARAVTILGATGRVRQYHWNSAQWLE